MPTHQERKLYLDVLRVAATVAVVLIHVSTLHYYEFLPRSLGWLTINLYDGMARWAVPVFVMISGALFLDPARDFSLRRLLSKNVVRILAAFGFWSFVYACIYANGFQDFLYQLLTGHFHMWFMLMIAALYLLIPLYRKFTATPEHVKYFLVIGALTGFLIPELLSIPALATLKNSLGKLCSYTGLGYSVYFVGGWYLSTADFSKRQRKIIYVLGIVGFLYTITGTSLLTYLREQATPDPFYNYFSTGVLLESAALFVLARYGLQGIQWSGKTQRILIRLSTLSLGVYLCHILFMDLVQRLGLSVMSFPALLSVPVMTCVIFLLSTLCSAIIHQVPVLRKYIV